VKRPNILLIYTDQHRNGAMSFMAGRPGTGLAVPGAPAPAGALTPALDALSARGLSFANSYCPSPLCSPSRASLVTGVMPHRAGVITNHQGLDPGVPHLGGIMREAGYETAWAGKWHVPGEYPLGRDTIPGFDNLTLPGRLTDNDGYPLRVEGKPGNWMHNLGSYVDVPVAGAATAFLKQPHDRPFLLVVSLMNPHDICFPEAYDRAGSFRDDELPPLPRNFEPPNDEAAVLLSTRYTHEGSARAARDWDDRAWRTSMALYNRFVGQVDAPIGTVLTALRDAGLEDDTVVIYTSDHGEGTAAHRWLGKLSLYEEAVTVPFIVAGPGVPGGRMDGARLVSGLDVTPTILGYAGVPVPSSMDGTNLKPLVEDASLPGRECVFCAQYRVWKEAVEEGRMARTARYKYAAYHPGKPSEMLFDLLEDPGEMRNLAPDPRAAGELRRHRELLRLWLDRTGDPFPFGPKDSR